jgi:hypothetical protein
MSPRGDIDRPGADTAADVNLAACILHRDQRSFRSVARKLARDLNEQAEGALCVHQEMELLTHPTIPGLKTTQARNGHDKYRSNRTNNEALVLDKRGARRRLDNICGRLEDVTHLHSAFDR